MWRGNAQYLGLTFRTLEWDEGKSKRVRRAPVGLKRFRPWKLFLFIGLWILNPRALTTYNSKRAIFFVKSLFFLRQWTVFLSREDSIERPLFFPGHFKLKHPWSGSSGGSQTTILRSLTEGTTGFIFASTRSLFGSWIKSSGKLCIWRRRKLPLRLLKSIQWTRMKSKFQN